MSRGMPVKMELGRSISVTPRGRTPIRFKLIEVNRNGLLLSITGNGAAKLTKPHSILPGFLYYEIPYEFRDKMKELPDLGVRALQSTGSSGILRFDGNSSYKIENFARGEQVFAGQPEGGYL